MSTLFDDIARSDVGPARYGEPTFPYWNRTARADVAIVRTELETWFSRYPHDGRADLRARFRSSNDLQHYAAFFELFLHELLRRLGCAVETHPSVPSTSRRPEFRVTAPDGFMFYLEAKVATDVSSAEAIAKARLNAVYAALDSIDSPDFWINAEVDELPHTHIPVKRLIAFVRERLAAAPHEMLVAATADELRAARWQFEHDGWTLGLFLLPKGNARGKATRSLGIQSYGARWLEPVKPIRTSILQKAKRYGTPDLPFVIAVNALVEVLEDDQSLEVLFGSEEYVSRFPGDDFRLRRKRDGVWTRPSGQYKRLSAVLLFHNLQSWNFPSANGRLYLHPAAAMPLKGPLLRLPQGLVVDGRMEYVDGESIGQVFGIGSDWLARGSGTAG